MTFRMGKRAATEMHLGSKEVYQVRQGEALVYAKQLTVSQTLDGVESNAPSSVAWGDGLVVTLVATAGNKVQANSVVVTMGGVDITSTAYDHSTKKVTIASVTGNVGITAVGRPYDAEVEWLQSDGNQYIDTGFKHNQNTRYVGKLAFPGTIAEWSYPFGSFGGASGSNKLLTVCINASKMFASYYGTGTSHAFNISAAGTHTFDFNKNVHKLDNTTYTFTARTFSSEYNALVFTSTAYDGTPRVKETQTNVYYFQIYDNGTLVRDFIPARKDGVGYLYDKVSGQLFGNAGSGAFTYGNDK